MEPAWNRVAQILEAALDYPAPERESFLDRECGGDEALRREVESLLAHDREGSRYLRSAVSTAAESAQGLHPGERIGGYEILHEIGRGGMGAVYLAVRADDTYRRQVALKVVKRGMDSDFVVARFRQERQILAALEHPSIARLYDGGATADGRPYLVMEYVEGLPVSEYCRQEAPRLAERLRLFLEICEAVDAAHRRLIVHRDLKPSNILVKSNGSKSTAEVKLLDFGIAKLLNEDLSETAALTQTTMRLLTPEYASPEQVLQRAVTTSTDIYALGLVLYEMLTEERAHKIRDLSAGDWERWVLETEPAKPSSIRGPFAGRLEGDLDNIIGKALRKEPERRYLTVREFRDDIERYLRDQPVSARPDTIAYRAGKFFRRHRIPVIAAALVAASLVVGAGVALHQARIARENAERAERRFAQVRTLARTLLFDLDAKIQNLPGHAPVRESLVKTSLEYLDSLSREAAGDTGLQAELAEAYLRVATIQGGQYRANLGRTPEAEQSLKKAVALQEALVAARPGDPKQSLALARTLLAVSDLDEKQGHSNTGIVDQAVARIEAAAQAMPADGEVLKALATAYTHAYSRY
ncbi:MAG: serine/threonine protein kinase, partial [Bryobacteraceae bacterium]